MAQCYKAMLSRVRVLGGVEADRTARLCGCLDTLLVMRRVSEARPQQRRSEPNYDCAGEGGEEQHRNVRTAQQTQRELAFDAKIYDIVAAMARLRTALRNDRPEHSERHPQRHGQRGDLHRQPRIGTQNRRQTQRRRIERAESVEDIEARRDLHHEQQHAQHRPKA